jgi:hypothetical protein
MSGGATPDTAQARAVGNRLAHVRTVHLSTLRSELITSSH